MAVSLANAMAALTFIIFLAAALKSSRQQMLPHTAKQTV
jgi:hypothetical protein